MDKTYQNAIFMKDNEGIIVLADIDDVSLVVRGEIVYDGKNAVVLNRNNKHYYILKNIPPFLRDDLLKSKEITIYDLKPDD